jgi:thiol-disulfide isomerase/thioredoxin
MTPFAYRLTAVLFGVLFLGLNVSMKRELSFQELEQATQQIQQPRLWSGKVAPEVQVPLRDGTIFRLSEHVGRKLVILNFFATWCGPCRQEMPEFNRFVARSAGKPVILVSIDAKEEPHLVDKFVKDLKITFPVGIDATGEVLAKFGVRSYPTTLIVGVDGRIAMFEAGAILNTEVAFDPFLKAATAELRAERGIGVDAWQKQVQAENYRDVSTVATRDKDGVALSGRAAEIAAHMNCPCGCTHILKDCTCTTATSIKKKLKEGNFGDRTNVQVAEDLNREFCMKGM